MEPAATETPKSGVESAAMKPAKSAAVKSAAPVKPAAPAVETAAPAAMRPGVGEIWLAERGSAQQSSCDCQRPSDPGPGSRFA